MSSSLLTRRAAVLLAAAAGAAALVRPRDEDAGGLPSCDDVTAPPPLSLSSQEQEEHAIFLSLAMALVFDAWGVDARRADLVASYAAAEPGRIFPDYLGHNIGALLVDAQSHVVCFALNRNVVLNSTLEHAEARAIRAGISRANAERPADGADTWTFGQLLKSDRIYATLEPCAQCAGIMDLASIGTVIYGQDDPAQHHITNVLYNLSRLAPKGSDGPLPVRATFAPSWAALAAAYDVFVSGVPEGGRLGVTSFLETVTAYRIFREAAKWFATLRPQFRDNTTILAAARAFRARWQGTVRRGLVPS
jgi:tRNA(Arg) A34 adenosine deaminase TadA